MGTGNKEKPAERHINQLLRRSFKIIAAAAKSQETVEVWSEMLLENMTIQKLKHNVSCFLFSASVCTSNPSVRHWYGGPEGQMHKHFMAMKTFH